MYLPGSAEVLAFFSFLLFSTLHPEVLLFRNTMKTINYRSTGEGYSITFNTGGGASPWSMAAVLFVAHTN